VTRGRDRNTGIFFGVSTPPPPDDDGGGGLGLLTAAAASPDGLCVLAAVGRTAALDDFLTDAGLTDACRLADDAAFPLEDRSFDLLPLTRRLRACMRACVRAFVAAVAGNRA
jgi:hypothetical protein